MEIIKQGNLNVLVPKEGYLLKDKNEILEDGEESYLVDKIFLANSISTLEQCNELWEEVKYIEEINELEEEV